ncbi:hypothetical protein [Nocardia sp. CDC160]|uniref:hypothetical protein n=1 Tax=Nocardia sp. CDC160 TaxID=3112166 RepID=UPI002DB9DFFA|nr:hypothetical protein [Nocardia sp. CDC160]MEC3920348.1 hypothetical protein [Nocardia sp. CDC160]
MDEITVFTTATAQTRDGSVAVTCTEIPLPQAITLTQDALFRAPQDLANDILRLCRQAADRAKLLRRAELTESGVPAEVLDLLGLPRAEEIARMEALSEQEFDYEPRSWLSYFGDTGDGLV